MLENYKVITINHRKLNVNELDEFVIQYSNKEELQTHLDILKVKLDLDEIMYLSTCNRVVYITHTEQVCDLDFARKLFSQVNQNLSKESLARLESFLDIYEGEPAINHLFELTSSIDSLVVGEREIIRQFRQSYTKCQEMALTGDYLRLVEKYSTLAAKAVYANTRIGEKPVSIVSLAFKKLIECGVTSTDRVLMIGAGETNYLIANFLNKNEFKNITIFNRSLDNAKALSEKLNAKAAHLSELNHFDKGFDCIIACTSATEAIVTEDLYIKLLNGEKGRKVLLDLSIPNNIEKSISDNHNAIRVDIEDLRELAEKNLDFRKEEIKAARVILREHLTNFKQFYKQRQIEKSFAQLPVEISAIKKRALEEVYKKDIEKLDSSTQELLIEMMTYMEKKCVGIPMKMAKGTVG